MIIVGKPTEQCSRPSKKVDVPEVVTVVVALTVILDEGDVVPEVV